MSSWRCLFDNQYSKLLGILNLGGELCLDTWENPIDHNPCILKACPFRILQQTLWNWEVYHEKNREKKSVAERASCSHNPCPLLLGYPVRWHLPASLAARCGWVLPGGMHEWNRCGHGSCNLSHGFFHGTFPFLQLTWMEGSRETVAIICIWQSLHQSHHHQWSLAARWAGNTCLLVLEWLQILESPCYSGYYPNQSTEACKSD